MRRAGGGDWAAIGQVGGESWHAAYRGPLRRGHRRGTRPGREALGRGFAAQPGHSPLVAVSAGTVIGFAAFGPERLPRTGVASEDPQAESYAIHVPPQHWSAGAGRALLRQVVAECRASRYGSIGLWVLEGNARACRFY
ncbi:MAG TPA: GNAT family N-acetyltransferase [Streptosporangiaceae bacterium]|nr:GNAT family N-acetyltransferase [Streptosporangiaceae bacterium]